MNKKLISIFVFLVLGLFVISACSLIKQEGVGAKVNTNIAGGVDVARGDNIIINTIGTATDLSIKINGRNNMVERIFYYDYDRRRIRLGSDTDEPLIVEEQAILNAEGMGESELSRMTGVKFIYDINKISHIVRIKSINTLDNKISFKVVDTGREYENLVYNDGRDTNFNFLEAPFTLIFESRNNKIIFYHITDEGDGRAKIRTENNGAIALYQDGGIDIYNPQNRQRDYINIDLKYNAENQEINPFKIEIGENGWMSNSKITLNKVKGAGVDEIKIKY